MIEMLRSWGLASQSPNQLQAGDRRTEYLIDLMYNYPSRSGNAFSIKKPERTPSELKKLAKSALPSRAITLIRHGVSGLEYGLQTKKFVTDESERLIADEASKIVRTVVDSPNPTDEDFGTFSGQVIEDTLTFDAGSWEYIERPGYETGNNILGLEVVPGYTLYQNSKWNQKSNGVRWAQKIPNTQKFIPLLDKDIEYLSLRKFSYSMWGYSPLESAAEIMDAWVHLSSYQQSLASSAYPPIMLYLGESVTKEQAAALKMYWENELVGRGRPGIWGNTGKPEAIELKGGEDSLYLLYQEMLVRALAFTFGLKPQDFGIERDVNRSTAAVSQQASVEEARKPMAQLISKKINKKVIPRIATITGNEYIKNIKFFYEGLTQSNKKLNSEIDKVYLENDVYTLDKVRKAHDEPPLPGGLGSLTPTAFKELSKKRPEVVMALMLGKVTFDQIANIMDQEPAALPAGG